MIMFKMITTNAGENEIMHTLENKINFFLF